MPLNDYASRSLRHLVAKIRLRNHAYAAGMRKKFDDERHSAPHLPTELIDYIVDYLSDEPRALINCAMASRLFIPRSRRHLYGAIHLDQRSDVRAFFALLDSPSCSITPFVHHLDIQDAPDELLTSKWVTEYLPRFKPFVAVKSLRLQNLRWDPFIWDQLISTFRQIRELEMSHVEFEFFHQIAVVLCAFPALERVGLYQSQGIHPSLPLPLGPQISSDLCPPPGLKSLEIAAFFIQPMFEWLLTQSAPSTVDTIYLAAADAAHVSSAGDYLKILGSSLKHLHLSFLFPPGMSDGAYIVSSDCTSETY
jgi:hypothetical protein